MSELSLGNKFLYTLNPGGDKNLMNNYKLINNISNESLKYKL